MRLVEVPIPNGSTVFINSDAVAVLKPASEGIYVHFLGGSHELVTGTLQEVAGLLFPPTEEKPIARGGLCAWLCAR